MAVVNCPKCGNAFDDKGKLPNFCPKCGAKLNLEVESVPSDVRSLLEPVVGLLKTCDLRAAKAALDRVQSRCQETSDLWYMYALSSVRDYAVFVMYMGMASSPDCHSEGIFTAQDVVAYQQMWKQDAESALRTAVEMKYKNNNNAASQVIERAQTMDPGCSDVWYLKASIAGDPVWRRRYIMAGDGIGISKGIYRKEELAQSVNQKGVHVKFTWTDAEPGMRMRIEIDDTKVVNLSSEGLFTSEVLVPPGNHKVRATMIKADGYEAGRPSEDTISVTDECGYELKTQGMFKSKVTFVKSTQPKVL